MAGTIMANGGGWAVTVMGKTMFKGCLGCPHFITTLNAHVTHVGHHVWQGYGVTWVMLEVVGPMFGARDLVRP